ncbi:hypothetical protein NP233_g6465 [Leucocoprinus birnbaumii]|uniref:Glycosyltransferase family 32 protein n=1 Tax=Leucocoprinus birnbaumii TaxID=56174 RepID=A0AAD5VUH4_9AGAR|nr:hypothetical protein NP233_g6465 [Leucocoprinus birnbaumii]
MYAPSHSSSSTPAAPVSPRLRTRANPLLTNDSLSAPRLSHHNSLPLYIHDRDHDENRARPGSPKPRSHPYASRRGGGLFSGPRIFALVTWLAKYIIPLCLILLFGGFVLFEPHLEFAFYSRKWVKQEMKTLEPLGGCFNPDRMSTGYNVSEYVYGPKKVDVQAGLPLRFGMDCYDFAGTIRSSSKETPARAKTEEERTIFHTYWRVDLAAFGHRQEWMLKSFFATQDLDSTKLILWSNGDLGSNEILRGYVRKYPESFALRVVDIQGMAKGTPLDGSDRLRMNDKKAWLDGDLLRLLLLWNYGGVWVDMDSLLTRDLEPLFEHEFVTQWDCYDKAYSPFNGALLRFRKHSPYLCEAFYIMATSTPPRPSSTDWGSTLYLKLWRRLVAESIPPFKVLPFCFNDGRSCRLDNRLPDPFKPDSSDGSWTQGMTVEEGGGLDQVLQKVFAVHLHNQWDKEFPKGGWVERLLLRRYDKSVRGE